MPIDPAVLAEARALIDRAGMSAFRPTSAAPVSEGGQMVEIALIDPVAVRSNGNFNQPDADRPGVIRSDSILAKIRDGVPLEPVLLIHRPGWQRYRLWQGFHRLHLCAALGYTHVYADLTTAEY